MSYSTGDDVIARMYDGDYDSYRVAGDVEFYVGEAKRRGVPVVEFACGTGRVLVPTLAASIDITGVDVSGDMVERCRQNIAAAGLMGTIHHGDMRTVELGRTFGLATLPFRPFQHMLSIEDQLAALRNIRRHLMPGGTLIFDVFQPLFRRIALDGAAEELDLERTDENGAVVRRFSKAVSHRWRQVIDVTLRWEIESADGTIERCSASFEMRWFVEPEIRHLLARSGFEVETVYGSFDRAPTDNAPSDNPVGPDSKELVFVATAVS